MNKFLLWYQNLFKLWIWWQNNWIFENLCERWKVGKSASNLKKICLICHHNWHCHPNPISGHSALRPVYAHPRECSEKWPRNETQSWPLVDLLFEKLESFWYANLMFQIKKNFFEFNSELIHKFEVEILFVSSLLRSFRITMAYSGQAVQRIAYNTKEVSNFTRRISYLGF